MAPLLSPDYHEKGRKDVVLASMWDAGRKARRGEVVAFRAPHDPERVAIKRIVGVEGDIVDTSGGSGDAYPEREVRVPPGHVWVEGVDGGRSLDNLKVAYNGQGDACCVATCASKPNRDGRK
ncbi:MAG: hypothetical protein M1819_003433 [Sarea resinae]|nr:MAG: hypothetical protein M1819_003433 [Sarea resinae]